MTSQPRPCPGVGEYDPSLGRVRSHSDDFYDHRKLVLKNIGEARSRERTARPRRKTTTTT